jgi:hypothetical protein
LFVDGHMVQKREGEAPIVGWESGKAGSPELRIRRAVGE